MTIRLQPSAHTNIPQFSQIYWTDVHFVGFSWCQAKVFNLCRLVYNCFDLSVQCWHYFLIHTNAFKHTRKCKLKLTLSDFLGKYSVSQWRNKHPTKYFQTTLNNIKLWILTYHRSLSGVISWDCTGMMDKCPVIQGTVGFVGKVTWWVDI